MQEAGTYTRYAVLAQAAAIARLWTFAEESGVAVREGKGWFAVRTGVCSNDMNGVVSDSGASVSAHLIEDLISWFDRAPATWMISDPGCDLSALLVAAGARAERTGRWSGREIPVGPSTEDAGVSTVPVESSSELDAWINVAAQCGWVADDHDMRARYATYRPLLRRDCPLRNWLAVDATGPVGFASSYLHGKIIDLCNLGVVPSRRRRGVGRALTSARLRAATAMGATTVVSAPSPDGWALQRRLDFRSVPVTPDVTFYLPSSGTDAETCAET